MSSAGAGGPDPMELENDIEGAAVVLRNIREAPASDEQLAAYALLRLKLGEDIPGLMKMLDELPGNYFESPNALDVLAKAASEAELIKLNNIASDELEKEGGILDRLFEVEESGKNLDTLASVAATAEAVSTVSEAMRKLGELPEEEDVSAPPPAKRVRNPSAAASAAAAIKAEAEAKKADRQAKAAAAVAAAVKKAEAAKRIPTTGELVAYTPSVNRSSHLASISSTDGQIRGNYGTSYLRNVYSDDTVQKYCWICGLPIFAKSDTKNSNEYEHVQAFKTALFESMLYVPDNILGHIGGNYRLARQCIGEYSHNNCNGGGSVVSKTGGYGGRTGKGDLSLKTGGRNGNWNDLYPSSGAIKELLVGSDGFGKDPKCIWAQFEPYQRKEFKDSADKFYRARKDIVYARVAQVCYMVRRCVDWKQHALAKGIALKSVISGGENVKDQLLTLFKNSSALKPYPKDIVQNKMYMQPYSPSNSSALFGRSLTVFRTKKSLEEFVEATINDFNSSYGAAITGIRVDTEDNIKRLLDSGVIADPAPPMAPAVSEAGVVGKKRGGTLKRARAASRRQQQKLTRKRRRGPQVTVEIVPYRSATA